MTLSSSITLFIFLQSTWVPCEFSFSAWLILLASPCGTPYFLDAYGAACQKKLGRLARIAGVASPNASDSEAAEAFIRWIRETNAKMGIPETIPQIRTVDIPEMAHHAAKERTRSTPFPC